MKKIIALLTLLVWSACSSSSASQQSSSQAEEEVSVTPSLIPASFDVDSAYAYVAYQVALGERTPGSKAHQACGDWIVAKLRSWGYEVTEQAFSGREYFDKQVKGRNIIASQKTEISSGRVLLMAHWDTRQVADQDPNLENRKKAILGADDGASGVGVLLELARQNALLSNPRPLDFVFFDLEDGGKEEEESWCLGSQYWAKNPHRSDYIADYGILLDMVGAKGAKFYWERYSKAYAAPLLAKLWDTAHKLGFGELFIQQDGGALVDDHVPVIRERGIPSVDIVNYSPENEKGFARHWHTQMDDLNIIDKNTLKAVGVVVATTLELK